MSTIVCLGDSITCEWDKPKYPTFWQKLLDKKYGQGKIKVISAGVNGETAQDGYYRLNTDVLPHHPDLVTIMFGHNDVYLKVPPKIFERYLDIIIGALRQYQIKDIWLLSPNQPDEPSLLTQYQPYLQVLKLVAQAYNVPYLDLWSAFNDHPSNTIYTQTFDTIGLSGHDYIHPNPLGHQLIAESLMKAFNPLAL